MSGDGRDSDVFESLRLQAEGFANSTMPFMAAVIAKMSEDEDADIYHHGRTLSLEEHRNKCVDFMAYHFKNKCMEATWTPEFEDIFLQTKDANKIKTAVIGTVYAEQATLMAENAHQPVTDLATADDNVLSPEEVEYVLAAAQELNTKPAKVATAVVAHIVNQWNVSPAPPLDPQDSPAHHIPIQHAHVSPEQTYPTPDAHWTLPVAPINHSTPATTETADSSLGPQTVICAPEQPAPAGAMCVIATQVLFDLAIPTQDPTSRELVTPVAVAEAAPPQPIIDVFGQNVGITHSTDAAFTSSESKAPLTCEPVQPVTVLQATENGAISSSMVSPPPKPKLSDRFGPSKATSAAATSAAAAPAVPTPGSLFSGIAWPVTPPSSMASSPSKPKLSDRFGPSTATPVAATSAAAAPAVPTPGSLLSGIAWPATPQQPDDINMASAGQESQLMSHTDASGSLLNGLGPGNGSTPTPPQSSLFSASAPSQTANASTPVVGPIPSFFPNNNNGATAAISQPAVNSTPVLAQVPSLGGASASGWTTGTSSVVNGTGTPAHNHSLPGSSIASFSDFKAAEKDARPVQVALTAEQKEKERIQGSNEAKYMLKKLKFTPGRQHALVRLLLPPGGCEKIKANPRARQLPEPRAGDRSWALEHMEDVCSQWTPFRRISFVLTIFGVNEDEPAAPQSTAPPVTLSNFSPPSYNALAHQNATGFARGGQEAQLGNTATLWEKGDKVRRGSLRRGSANAREDGSSSSTGTRAFPVDQHMANGEGKATLEDREIAEEDDQMVDRSKVGDDGDHTMQDSEASGSGGNTTAPVVTFPPHAPSASLSASAPTQPNNAPAGSQGWQPTSSTSSTVSAPNGNISSFAGSTGGGNTPLEDGEIVEDDQMVGSSEVVSDGDHTMQDSEASGSGGNATAPVATFPPPASSANLLAWTPPQPHNAPTGSLGWPSSGSASSTVSAPNGNTSFFAGSSGGFNTNMTAVPFGSSFVASAATQANNAPTGSLTWQPTSSTSSTVSAPNGNKSSFAGSFGGYGTRPSALVLPPKVKDRVIWFNKADELEDQDMEDSQTTAEGAASSSPTVGLPQSTNASPPSVTPARQQQGAHAMMGLSATQQPPHLPTPPPTPPSVSPPSTQAVSTSPVPACAPSQAPQAPSQEQISPPAITTPSPPALNASTQAPSQPQISSPAIPPPTGWTPSPRPAVKSEGLAGGSASSNSWSSSPFPKSPPASTSAAPVVSTSKPPPFSALVGPATKPVQVPQKPLVAPSTGWKPPPPPQFSSAFPLKEAPATPSPTPRPAAPVEQESVAASDVGSSTAPVAALDAPAPERLGQASASNLQSPTSGGSSAQEQEPEPEPYKPRLNSKMRSLARGWFTNHLGQSTPSGSSSSSPSTSGASGSVSPLALKTPPHGASSSRRSPPGSSPLGRQSFSAATLAKEAADEEAAAVAPIVTQRKRRERDHTEQVGVPDGTARPIKAHLRASGKGKGPPVAVAAGSSVADEAPTASKDESVAQVPADPPTCDPST
ncbi:uncharacterized protein LOC62_07G009576 [Vanrija pseudolonga]|uniref:Uncharacterized protein n=1 Tax=Vanrija pseudolonga TaxID=143232 RepID=A0AAF0YI50_9TREE|nr:hypothetical protein LOC62_07G009576 [Vanrija pseudolonga]